MLAAVEPPRLRSMRADSPDGSAFVRTTVRGVPCLRGRSGALPATRRPARRCSPAPLGRGAGTPRAHRRGCRRGPRGCGPLERRRRRSAGWSCRRCRRRERRPVTEPGRFDVRGLFSAPARHGVEYVTIGGIAIQAYGGQRFTQDLDVAVAAAGAMVGSSTCADASSSSSGKVNRQMSCHCVAKVPRVPTARRPASPASRPFLGQWRRCGQAPGSPVPGAAAQDQPSLVTHRANSGSMSR